MLGRLARTPSALAGTLLLATAALAAIAPPAQADPLPPTAVAMGDSFISGEGAGGYVAVTDQSGVAQGFPGWAAANSNPYFCHRSANASIQVGYTGWWEVWIHFVNWVTGEELNERACSDADFATAAQLDAARAETAAAVRQVLDVLDEVDADGDHRVVLQDYTNPLPQAYAEQYRTESGRSDTRDKYRALVDERYAAGCPADIASLAPAHRFSQNLGSLVAGVLGYTFMRTSPAASPPEGTSVAAPEPALVD